MVITPNHAIQPMLHISGWTTYQVTMLREGEERESIFFAPNDEAATRYAERMVEDLQFIYPDATLAKLERAYRPPCPVCNGAGWADGKGHYAATECGGQLLRCRACGGTGEVPCA